MDGRDFPDTLLLFFAPSRRWQKFLPKSWMFRKTVLYFQHVAIAIIIAIIFYRLYEVVSCLKKDWPILTFIYYLQKSKYHSASTTNEVWCCFLFEEGVTNYYYFYYFQKSKYHNASTTNEVWCCFLCSSRSDLPQPSWTHPRKPGWRRSVNIILYFILGEVPKYKRNTFLARWIHNTQEDGIRKKENLAGLMLCLFMSC